VRTVAEGASEDELAHDVARLSAQWEAIEKRSQTANPPELLYSEPDLTIRVVRDIFNEDFTKLVVSGEQGWDLVDEYVHYVAPHLAGRLEHWQAEQDAFGQYRIDEQLGKALERKVWLPSGGSLVIDTTEAMTVIDVNTGKFTGQGGNLEETVTRNNLEAAEEIVRQLRLRDTGGIIVIDFIDMVLESNRELVLRRLLECLSRDRTKHQVAEVTSLGLVQMTRKRVGSGLLEAFSQPCECCNGRGVLISLDGADHVSAVHRGRGEARAAGGRPGKNGGGREGSGGKTSQPSKKAGDASDAGRKNAGVAGPDGQAAPDGEAAPAGGAVAEPVSGGADAPHPTGGRSRRRAATREPGPPSLPDSVAGAEAGAATGAETGSAPGAETGAETGAEAGAGGETVPAGENQPGQQAEGSDGTEDQGGSASATAAAGF
jgi:ribonuclease E